MSEYKFETLQLHVGQEQADPTTDARAVPIYQTTSYVFRNSQHAADRFGLADAGNIYGRLTNSTQDVFEKRIAALESGVAALATASGAAAITYTIQALAQAGDHIVAQNTIYGGSYNLLAHTLTQFGVNTTFVDAHDLAQVEAAIQPNTKAVYLETLGNPNSDIPDIDAIADQVTNAVCGDPTNEMVLRAAGVTSYGCCVVCLGSDNMQESILVTLTLKELGIPKIVARASSEQHRKVLAKVGADKVVFPEKDMGQNLAYILSKTDVLEFINFSRNCSVVELKTPRRWAGKSIKDLDVRKKYGINIIAISKAGSNDDFEIFTDPDRVLLPEETLILIGGNAEIEKITGD